MTEKQIVNIINNFYPSNISPDDEMYIYTDQYLNFKKKVNDEAFKIEWLTWKVYLKNHNNVTNVIDFSTYSISTPCLKLSIGYFFDNIRYEIKFYVSLIAPYYTIKINELSVTNHGVLLLEERVCFQKILKKEIVYLFSNKEILNADVDNKIYEILAVETYFPNLISFPHDWYNVQIPNLHTNKLALGKGTIFNYLFNDHEF